MHTQTNSGFLVLFTIPLLAAATEQYRQSKAHWRGLQRGNNTPEGEWTNYTTDPGRVLCPQGENDEEPLVSGFGCEDSYCDNLRLHCQTSIAYPTTNWYWTAEISEETETKSVLCQDDYFVTGISCSGDWCDNVALRCTIAQTSSSATDRLAGRECEWSPWVSEENGGNVIFRNGWYARGIECRGHYCDDKRFWICPAVSGADAAPRCDITTTDLAVGIRATEGTVECDTPDALIVGLRCQYDYCENLRLTCESCGCAYSDFTSYWTESFSEDSPAMICDDDYFMTGVSCTEDFCGSLAMQCTFNSGRTAGTDCIWSGYSSVQGFVTTLASFEGGLYPRGMECRGTHCDEKRFLLCPAIDESEYSCDTLSTAPTTSPVPTATPTGTPTKLPTTSTPTADVYAPYLTLSDQELFAFQDNGPDNRIGLFCYVVIVNPDDFYPDFYIKAEPSTVSGDDGWPRRISDDTGDGRVKTARQRNCWYGPGVYDMTEQEAADMCQSAPRLEQPILNSAAQMRHAIRNGACGII